jgi:hypothetical protein
MAAATASSSTAVNYFQTTSEYLDDLEDNEGMVQEVSPFLPSRL